MAEISTDPILRVLLSAEQNGSGNALSDAELLRLFCQQGDTMAFAQLVQRYSRLVWRVCYRVLEHYQDAEDAFQAAFLVLATQARHIRKPEQLPDWLHGVALRISWKAKTMARRRKRREVEVAQRTHNKPASGDGNSETQALVHRALAKLPAHYRTVILLCDLQGLTRQEVANRLGVPEGTVASRLARARQLLARRLRQAGLAVAAGTLVHPVQDVLASPQPELISATLKLVGDVLSGNLAGRAGSTAYLLAKSLLRSLTMMRVGVWGTVMVALSGGLAAGILSLAALHARGDSATPMAGGLPPRPEAVTPNDLAKNSGTPVRQPERGDNPPAQPIAMPKADEESGHWLAQLAQFGNKARVGAEQKAPAAPEERGGNRWTQRGAWENDAPVAVAIAPTGESVAVADALGNVKLYSVKEEKPRTIREPRKAAQAPAAPVGGAGAFGGGGFGGFGGAVPTKSVPQEERIWDIAFSPSGTLLAVACGKRQHSPRVEVFSLQRLNDKEEWKLDQTIALDVKYEPRRVAFTPDGKTLLVGGFGRVLASYEVGSGKQIRDWTPLLSRKELFEVRDMQVSVSGRYLAATALWPLGLNPGKPNIQPGLGGGVGAGPNLNFDQPIRTSLIVVDLEKGERCWFRETNGKVSPFNPQLGVFERVAMSKDEDLLAAMRMDAEVEVMELRSGKVLRRFYAGEDDDEQPVGGVGKPPVKPGVGPIKPGLPPLKPRNGGGGGFIGGAGGFIGPQPGGRWPRCHGGGFSPDYWAFDASTPLVFFDPTTGRLVTWDFFVPGRPGQPRLWDAQTGKELGRWDASLERRVSVMPGSKTQASFDTLHGRSLVTVELQLPGGGFLGGGLAGGPVDQTEEQVHVVPGTVRLYSRDASEKSLKE